MMRTLVLALLLTITASLGNAQQNLSAEAQMDALSRADKRFVQAFLSITGDYPGRINGRWEESSQQALARYSARSLPDGRMTWRAIARILRQFTRDLSNGGWEPYYDDATNMSYQLPLSIMRRQPGINETIWIDTEAEILIRTGSGDLEATNEQHLWVVQNSAENPPAIRKKNQDRMITSSLLLDRINTVYVRSHRRGDVFSTTFVQWRAQKAPVARLVIASLVMGEQSVLQMADNGLLFQAMESLQREESGQPPEPTPEPEQPGQAVPFAGSGFFVNNTDLVTATSVKNSCRELQLEDGTILKPLGQNLQHGLAILTSPARSEYWLALHPQIRAQTGQILAAAGITSGKNAFQGVVPVRGQVMGDMQLGNTGVRLTLSMRPRKGMKGAPVLDIQNRVVGIMTDGPEGNQGQLEFLTPGSFLATMLERHRILYERHVGDGPSSDPSVFQSEIARAIVPLYCR